MTFIASTASFINNAVTSGTAPRLTGGMQINRRYSLGQIVSSFGERS